MSDERTVEERKEAKRAHELFVLNLIFFHLLAVPAGLAFGLGYWGMLVPLLSSSALLLYYQNRIRQLANDEQKGWVQTHWEQALKRFRWLYMGYAVVAMLLIVVSLFVEPDSIAFIALTRVAVMPAIVMVLVTFVLSTSALGKAGNGES
ncbi:MAG: hypothetical protein HOL04_06070 [Gammaproteobacteria bacterium]|jgi:uncharacterized membrane protein|nr:hypothetical protein [Gammaproteobacteria bacterium]MBT4606226.1 hypothetical protein [Thiotrichales bacterium]MBT4081996.1 hypothetical protein [Gammaproteobacteria bacterium]MBT4810847.1 hypothetical protein [Thiotrichales bacterium]MBT5361293.1 hypothetical protein [Gammaproteobacteria bacterium]